MRTDRSRPCPARRLAFFRVESLEDRALLSANSGASPLPAATPIESLAIDTPSSYVSQQATALDVTLVRSESEYVRQGGMTNVASVPLTGPLTVNFSASLGTAGIGGQNVSLPASARDTFTPVNESVTFPAGVSTLSVRIPINSGAANPGSVPIELSATSSTPGVLATSGVVYLVTGAAALPPPTPAIISAHLIFHGKIGTGIAITFSQPMAPASVANVHNYAVTTETEYSPAESLIAGLGSAGESQGPFYSRWPVPLKAAQYSPTTNTVTLIPKRPLKASVVYTIQNGDPLAKHALTDLQGSALRNIPLLSPGTGSFTFNLKGTRTDNWAAPEPATVFSGS
jgi:hypothetical protein